MGTPFRTGYEFTKLTTSGSYAAGDVIGGLLTLATGTRPGGTLRNLLLIDAANNGAALNLWLFSKAPSTFADNAAFAPSANDLTKLIGVVQIAATDYLTVNSLKVADVVVNREYVLNNNSNALYGYLVNAASGAQTYGANTLYITAWTWPND
jgi:hypothetical protein